jgi:hypothetical protein
MNRTGAGSSAVKRIMKCGAGARGHLHDGPAPRVLVTGRAVTECPER